MWVGAARWLAHKGAHRQQWTENPFLAMKSLKPHSAFRIVPLVFALVLLPVRSPAADRYWAPTGCDPNLGGAGTWDNGITANWSPNSTGGGCVTWNNAASDSAFFLGGAGYTVGVSGSKTVNKIFRVAGGANVNLTGSVTITFAGTDSGVDSDTSGYLTLSCNHAGTITKTGPGRLEANNANNTAKWILKAGMVTIAAANRLNTGTGGYNGSDFLTFDGGGLGYAIAATATSKFLPSHKGITVAAGGAFFGASASANEFWIESPVLDGTGGTGNGGLTVTTGSPLYSPYNAGGVLVLTNQTATPNNYRGPTRVFGSCTIRLGGTNQIPDHSPLEVRGGTFNTGGFSETVHSVLMTSGTITGSGTLTGTNGYDLRAGTCSTILGGAGVAATKSTTGILELSAANTFTGGFNHNGGTVRAGNNAALGAANSVVTLANGITLAANSATARTLTYAFTINGDITLGETATGTGALTLAGSVNLAGGTRTLQINNPLNTISAVVTNGGLTKAGTGTLRLTGANTYNGPTSVNEGRLLVTTASAGGGDYSVADGAVLEVATIPAGSSLLLSNMTLGNSTLEFDFASLGLPTNNVMSGTGDLTVNGLVTVNVKGFDVAGGPVTLLEYAGSRSGSGSFVTGFLPPRVVGAVTEDTPNKKLLFNATAADSLIWVGDSSTVWDVNNGGNLVWRLASDSSPTYYQENPIQGDTVRFDDTATGSTTVDILGEPATYSVNPFAITVDNTSKDYSFITTAGFGAPGRIAGIATLTKSGTGQLTITNANTYTGGTTLNAGIINLGHNSALGTGRLTVNGGTIRSDSPTARTLSVATTVNGNYTLQAETGTYGDLVLSGVISGAGSLTKIGSGVLDLTAGNTFTGGFNHNGGTVRVNNATALGAANSTVILADGVTLSTTAGTARTLTNVFHVNGDLSLGQATGGTAVLTLAGWINLGGANRNITTITNATISAVVTNGGITKLGDATLTLSGNNLYTGNTTNLQGALNPGTTAATPFGTGGTLYLAGGHIVTGGGRAALPILNPIVLLADCTWEGSTTGTGFRDFPVEGPISTVAGTLALKNAGTATGIWNVRLHTDGLNFTRPIVIGVTGDPGQVQLSSMNTNGGVAQTFSGVLSGYGRVNRAATVPGTGGTTILTAANTYSGGTTVADGTLLVNNTTGSATGTGAVYVYTNGVLGGTGTIAGAVIVTNGGVLSAGASVGVLTLQNGLDLSQGGTNLWELAANTTGGDGVNFDQLSLTGGNLALGGTSRLRVKFIGAATFPDPANPFWQQTNIWKVIALSGSAANPGLTVFSGVDGVEGNTAGTFTIIADAAGVYLVFTPSAAPPPPPVISPQIPGAGTTNAQLSWSSVAGAQYTVQYKSNLNQPGWLNLTTIVATGPTTTIVDNTSPVPPQRFYRVISP
jgi:autotransporter-associated beta strand protein